MKILILTLLTFSLFAQNEEGFDSIQNLTDEEMKASKTFHHNGKAERVYKEMCDNKESNVKGMDDLCTNNFSAFDRGQKYKKGDKKGEHKRFWQTVEQIMPAVGKVYSLIAGNLSLHKKGPIVDEKPTKGEEKKDMCGYIATGVEMSAGIIQKAVGDKSVENLNSDEVKSAQVQSLQALKDQHRSMRQTANIQLAGWGGTAACYGVMALGNTSTHDPNFWIKLSGSVLMGTFYQRKSYYHKKRMDQLDEIIDAMPGQGDCNPYTQRTCFCSEESTSLASHPNLYQKYCLPKMIANKPYGKATTCITKDGKSDPNCNCKLSQSCINVTLPDFAANFGLGEAETNALLKSLEPYSKGYASTDLSNFANKNLAFAKKMLKKKYSNNNIKPVSLSSKDKELARSMLGLGVPKEIATHIAAHKSSKFPNTVSSKSFEPKRIVKSKLPSKNRYKRGKNLSQKSTKSSSFNPFARKRKSNGAGTGIVVQDYDNLMDKATRDAEITKDRSKNLFEILSYRYKKRAWTQFKNKLEEKN